VIRRRLARRQRIGAFAARAGMLERQAVAARELAVAIPTTYAPPRFQPGSRPLAGRLQDLAEGTDEP
jgi:hypothetical protein